MTCNKHQKPARAPSRMQLNDRRAPSEFPEVNREVQQPVKGNSSASLTGNKNPPAGGLNSGGRGSPAGRAANPGAAPAGRAGNPGGRGGVPTGGRGRGMQDESDLDSILSGLDEPSKPMPQGRGPQRAPEPALPKGVCSGCRKPVTGEAIHALGRSYHPEHFMCSTCGKGIGTGSFYEREGQPQCDKCYQAVFCKRCANCKLPITSQLVTALGQPWHPKCFVCAVCKSSFAGGSFYEREGRPYCNNCFNIALNALCRRCNNPVYDNVVNALGTTWHAHHFGCEVCGVVFTDGQFWELDSMPYCEEHYREQIGDY